MTEMSTDQQKSGFKWSAMRRVAATFASAAVLAGAMAALAPAANATGIGEPAGPYTYYCQEEGKSGSGDYHSNPISGLGKGHYTQGHENIIPPTQSKPGGRNWDAAHWAIWSNNCGNGWPAPETPGNGGGNEGNGGDNGDNGNGGDNGGNEGNGGDTGGNGGDNGDNGNNTPGTGGEQQPTGDQTPAEVVEPATEVAGVSQEVVTAKPVQVKGESQVQVKGASQVTAAPSATAKTGESSSHGWAGLGLVAGMVLLLGAARLRRGNEAG